VVAAGALGTNRLLAGCKLRGSLPRISDRLGHLVRTNSESLLAVTLPDDRLAPWKDVAISASFHPDPDTHIEFVTYGRHGDFMSNLTTLLTGKGTRFTRPLRLLGNIARHRPLPEGGLALRLGRAHPHHPGDADAGQRDALPREARVVRGGAVSTEQDAGAQPTYIEAGNRAAVARKRTGGIAQSMKLRRW
jgi:cholesterol oxidase